MQIKWEISVVEKIKKKKIFLFFIYDNFMLIVILIYSSFS